MQKNASPRSWVAAYWRKPPIRLPIVLEPVGWMPEKTRIAQRYPEPGLFLHWPDGSDPDDLEPLELARPCGAAPAGVAEPGGRKGGGREARVAPAPRLRRGGARAAGGARRGRCGTRLPAPGGGLRRVVPRLQRRLDPGEAE